jgi:hypothetical protein
MSIEVVVRGGVEPPTFRGVADHEVTPQAPLTGSGCREYCYGGFGEATHTPPAYRLAATQRWTGQVRAGLATGPALALPEPASGGVPPRD